MTNPYAALDVLYTRLPKLDCKKLCQISCRGIIPAETIEIKRFEKRLGYKPKMRRLGMRPCPLLAGDGSCSVYRIRPLICRLWGLTPRMACPFGCVPERWLSEEEARLLAGKAEAISKSKEAERISNEGD